MVRMLRESSLGGYSECRSPEDKVGIGRCHHIAGSTSLPITYNKEDKCNYVEIKSDNSRKTLNKNKIAIKSFVDKLSENGITQVQAREIISQIS